MCRCVIGLLVVAALWGTAAEAQTITGRIEPTWDPELGFYTYGFDDSLLWRLEVAPSSARSDDLSVNLYYNKRAAVMIMQVFCREERPEDFEVHAVSYSGEHFLSLITGLITGEDCVLRLRGASDRNEVLSYRMAVSERVTRDTDLIESSTAAARAGRGVDAGISTVSPMVSQLVRRMARAIANRRRE